MLHAQAQSCQDLAAERQALMNQWNAEKQNFAANPMGGGESNWQELAARLEQLEAALANCGNGGLSAGIPSTLDNLCPSPGRWIGSGGGNMCQCPDGSFLSLGQACGASQQQYQAPPQVGDYCSNGGTCPVGSRCSSMPGKCVADGKVDCGSYSCDTGLRCASNPRYNGCLAPDAVDCGSYICDAGKKCSSGGCILQEATDCGNRTFCGAGLKCSRDKKSCLALGAVDCGKGASCPEGTLCQPGGKCITREGLAQQKAQAKQLIADAKEIAQERLAAARQAAADAKLAAQKREADARFDANLGAILSNRQASSEEKQIAAIALGKDSSTPNGLQTTGKESIVADRDLTKLALDKVSPGGGATSDASWIALANDPTQAPAVRQLAAAIAGIDLNKVGTGLVSQPTKALAIAVPASVNAGNNSISTLSSQVIFNAYSGNDSASLSAGGANNYTGPTQTQAACLALAATSEYDTASMRADMCDPSDDLAGRKIAAAALGLNMDVVLPIAGAGSLQAANNPIISQPSVWSGVASNFTVALVAPPSNGQSNKTTEGSAPTIIPIEVVQHNFTFNNSVFATVQDQSSVSTNPLNALNQFYASPLGSSLLDVASAGGGAVATGPMKAIGDTLDLANTGGEVFVLYQQGDYLGIGEIATSKIATTAAETVGNMVGFGVGGPAGAQIGGAIAASAAQATLDVGTKVVAPWVGNIIYQLSPSSVTP